MLPIGSLKGLALSFSLELKVVTGVTRLIGLGSVKVRDLQRVPLTVLRNGKVRAFWAIPSTDPFIKVAWLRL
jgi:hypothetical protein